MFLYIFGKTFDLRIQQEAIKDEGNVARETQPLKTIASLNTASPFPPLPKVSIPPLEIGPIESAKNNIFDFFKQNISENRTSGEKLHLTEVETVRKTDNFDGWYMLIFLQKF